MALQQPASVDECVYYTTRTLGKGSVRCWVLRPACPNCGKGRLGKPRDAKGKIKIRSEDYECIHCKYTAPLETFAETLTANILYTCPKCGTSGEHQMPFKRKRVKLLDEELQKESVAEALQFSCSCGEKINITKKMK